MSAVPLGWRKTRAGALVPLRAERKPPALSQSAGLHQLATPQHRNESRVAGLPQSRRMSELTYFPLIAPCAISGGGSLRRGPRGTYVGGPGSRVHQPDGDGPRLSESHQGPPSARSSPRRASALCPPRRCAHDNTPPARRTRRGRARACRIPAGSSGDRSRSGLTRCCTTRAACARRPSPRTAYRCTCASGMSGGRPP